MTDTTTTKRLRPAAVAAVLIALTAGLAGCAGDDETDAEPTSSAVETPAAAQELEEADEAAEPAFEPIEDGEYVSYNSVDVVLTTLTLEGEELRELGTACVPQLASELAHTYDAETGTMTRESGDEIQLIRSNEDPESIVMNPDGGEYRQEYAPVDSDKGQEIVAAYEQSCLDNYGEFEHDGRS